MKNPWFKFYPTDWRSDEELRNCGAAARGLWIEMLCLMHRASPYGHLLINGEMPTMTQLSMQAAIPESQIPDLIGELEKSGVFSRNGKGVIFSRKMVRDEKKSRTAEKNGKNGGNPSLCNGMDIQPSDNPEDKPPDKGEVKPQKPEAIYQKKTKAKKTGEYSESFERLWAAWKPFEMPKGNKQPAWEKFESLECQDQIISAAEQYIAECHGKKCKTQHLVTWLNQSGWEAWQQQKPLALDTSEWPDWKHKLAGRIGEKPVTSWFSNCELNGTALKVPKQFQADYIKTHYLIDIEATLGQYEIKVEERHV